MKKEQTVKHEEGAGPSAESAGPSRRFFLGTLAAGAALPMLAGVPFRARAQSGVLPLNTPGLDHLDVMVPDVEAAARFYMGLFDTRLHAQPFRGGFRYFVLLGDLPESRQVGYLAIGDSAGRGRDAYIGHFCTSVFDYRRDSQAISETMIEQFSAGGFGDFPGATGIGGIFADPDGIEIQFLPAPDTLVNAAEPAELALDGRGLVTPLGIDHVLLRVSDLDRAARYYRILYGPEAGSQGSPRQLWFGFANGSRLILEQAPYAYGQPIGIGHFCLRTQSFDTGAVRDRLAQLGAELPAAADESDVLRFRDLDGITVELKAV